MNIRIIWGGLLFMISSIYGFTLFSNIIRLGATNRSADAVSDRNVILSTIACGDDLHKDMAANLLRGMLMFADHQHRYVFLLFTDQMQWKPYFDEIMRNFTKADPKLTAHMEFYDIPPTAQDNLTDQFKRCAGFRITPGYYQRLIDQGYPRVIYVDADSMIWDDVSKLWQHFDQMDGKAFGLVTEEMFSTGWYSNGLRTKRYTTEDVFGDFGVNSGVILYDAVVAMRQGFPSAVEEITSIGKMKLFDQDTLNIACKNPKYAIECILVPCRWNFRQFRFHGTCPSELKEGIGLFHGNAKRLVKTGKLLEVDKTGVFSKFPISLWWLIFPCNERDHCLEKMEDQLNQLLLLSLNPGSSCNTYDDIRSLEYNGSETQFWYQNLTKPHWFDVAGIYCRQIDRVVEIRKWLQDGKS